MKNGEQNKINTSFIILGENMLNSPMKKQMIKFVYKIVLSYLQDIKIWGRNITIK